VARAVMPDVSRFISTFLHSLASPGVGRNADAVRKSACATPDHMIARIYCVRRAFCASAASSSTRGHSDFGSLPWSRRPANKARACSYSPAAAR